jgi:hypothetical protein
MKGKVAMSKYLGLCQTCDQDSTCTLKRSPKLEIIQCEEYSTQPIMRKRTSAGNDVSSSAASELGPSAMRGYAPSSLFNPQGSLIH